MKNKDDQNKEKSISRIDTLDTHGYQVRVYFKGKTYSKLFSDSKWDDPEIAREEAIFWRDEKEKELGKVRSNKYVSGLQATNTGVYGIKEVTKKYTDKQDKIREEHVLQVTIKDVKTTVSIRKYGFEKAMEIAIRKKDEIEFKLKNGEQ
jgi:hypothetical protein